MAYALDCGMTVAGWGRAVHVLQDWSADPLHRNRAKIHAPSKVQRDLHHNGAIWLMTYEIRVAFLLQVV